MIQAARPVRLLASLKLTLGLLLAAAAILVWGQVTGAAVGRAMALPFAGLFLNLMAAIAVHERLRRQSGLLVFHLGMAALALIAALGRLASFDGKVEVTQGGVLDTGLLVASSPAPLHPFGLGRVSFAQGPYTIDYAPGMRRGATASTVSVPDGQGGWHEKVVGDDVPLVLGGYRFYTTPNKGFAPLVSWMDAAGQEQRAAVHLPPYPAQEDVQFSEWPLPDGSRKVTLWLELSKPVYDENAAWTLKGAPADARLIVLDGERREVLSRGQSVALEGGTTLRYDGATMWMGYHIFYDPSLPWLSGAALVTVLGLLWHVLGRLKGLTEGPAWRRLGHAG